MQVRVNSRGAVNSSQNRKGTDSSSLNVSNLWGKEDEKLKKKLERNSIIQMKSKVA